VKSSVGNLLLDSGAGQVVFFGVKSAGATRRIAAFAGSAEVGLASGISLSIEGRSIHYGQALTVPAKTEDVDAVGLLPIRFFKAVYVCNSGGYVVLE
jgi:hypothetical protein